MKIENYSKMFFRKKQNKTKHEEGIKRKIYIKGDYEIELFVTSMSISILLMSFAVLFNVLEPRKHTSDDLSREKQVLALIHAIVVCYSSPFLLAINLASRLR